MNLTQLANAYGSDKGNVGTRCHKYTYLYDLLFFDRRMDQLNVLEEWGWLAEAPRSEDPRTAT